MVHCSFMLVIILILYFNLPHTYISCYHAVITTTDIIIWAAGRPTLAEVNIVYVNHILIAPIISQLSSISSTSMSCGYVYISPGI